jgi:hypothetical protein
MDLKHGESHASRIGNQHNATKTTPKGRPGPKLPQPFRGRAGHPGEKRIDDARSKTTSGNAAQLHQPAPSGAPLPRERGVPGEPRAEFHPLALSGTRPPNPVVPHRGPAMAAIGGPAISRAWTTAVINGTGMKHKP